ncbi:hypothetical protein HD597_003935 [Nonomuraea thailandensis]|uniref:Uncharacterized protein n=1 Tax=Nonomuraea thailandensis TaxID=1188745 RepID=A0A9X2GFW3_9ACTN|nr:hypothetical protein [Nonomuraea thailandensis]MCP2356915.1 hypothetical protein [Nonomuraea thailandensis]
MTEPPESLQRDVLRRHPLPDRVGERAACPDGAAPEPEVERDWLARVVAAQQARQNHT